MKRFIKTILSGIMALFLGFYLVCSFNEFKVKAAPIDLSTYHDRLIFHYQGDTSKFNHMWIWPKDGSCNAWYAWAGEDENGFAITSYILEMTPTVTEYGFIVVKGEWDEKDATEADRFVNLTEFTPDANNNYHVYLVQGDVTVYSKPGVVQPAIYDCSINKEGTNYVFYVKTNVAFKDLTIKNGDTTVVTYADLATDPNVLLSDAKQVKYNLGSDFPDLTKPFTVDLTFDSEDDNENPIEVNLAGSANVSSLYKDSAFANNFTYDGELGAIYSQASTTFKVWSPVSTSIKLRIYETGTPALLGGSDAYVEKNMTLGEKGVFSVTVDGDLEGKYYTYVVTNGNYTNREVVDPYAKSCGVNGKRGMIVDFSKTNPEGWDQVKIHEIPSTQLTVWETHIADLTSSTTWGGPEELAKTYKGFYQTGTTYTANGKTVKTGFDHVKELGVNAVQIIPIFDSDNDEINTEFNWGYNPLNYNALDGSYSTNPYDGYERIKEFKNLVKAYNEAGINIIMDVVYNHVMSAKGSNFDVLMPGYYYRYNGAALSNGSGCGNETASEMPMMRKFMIDSTEFWAKEYKLGGFRFDLMALHDLDTMELLSNNLHTNVSEYLTVYGEPWTGGSSPLDSSMAASQANLSKYNGYGQFNDQMRDALIKGGMNAVTAKGWITNSSSANAAEVRNIIKGITGMTNVSVTDPNKSVQYVTCHDNYTLYDRIAAIDLAAQQRGSETIYKKKAILANSIVFTSQGITFMLSGEEFLRTKKGNENSYNASYEVNELNYALKIQNYDMFEIYQKLIAFKQKSGVSKLTAAAIESDVKVTQNEDGSVIIIRIHDDVENKEYLVIHHNGVMKDANSYGFNLSGYQLYLSTLGTEASKVLTEQYEVGKYETLILEKEYNAEDFAKEVEPFVVEKGNSDVTPTPSNEEPAATPSEGLSTGALVAIICATVVAVILIIYLITGLTLYKSGVISGAFFDAIYKWVKKN